MVFQNCIEIYKEELLKIIPVFYNEKDISYLPPLILADRKSFFVNTEETLSPRRKRWVERCAGFIRVMERDVLPYLKISSTSPLIRFKFFVGVPNHEHLEKDLVDGTALSIFSCFISYLKYLRNVEKCDKDQAVQIVKEKMHSQGRKWLQEYEGIKEKSPGSKDKMKSKKRISDNKFKKLCKEVKKECSRVLVGEKTFFKELSKMSKDTKYDKTGKGYTLSVVKRKYYEVFHANN